MTVRIPIWDPDSKGLSVFFRRLSCLKKRSGVAAPGGQGGLVRVAHYGDSIIAGDRVSSGARQVMQGRFGDGGHGFFLLVPPTPWYHRAGLLSRRSRYWRHPTIQTDWLHSHRYGYGGGQARTAATGAWVRARLRPEGAVGGRADVLRLYFDRHPHGGWIGVRQGRSVRGRVDTRGTGALLGTGSVPLDPSRRRVTITLGGGGAVRLYGAALERTGPGVVWDGLGLTGATFATLGRLPADHFRAALRQRGVSLVVFQYGANVSDYRHLPETWYRRAVSRVLGRIGPLRRSLSCLVVGPVDRGYAHHWGWPSRAAVETITRIQREEAAKVGCAFWSARAAMGGKGSAGRWRRARPPLIWNDLTHLRPAGARLMGQTLAHAILTAYDAWRLAHPRPVCGR